MSCGVGCGCGLDPTLLWLWYRPAAVAPIRSLAWEPPEGAALEKAKRPKKTKKKKKELNSRRRYNNCKYIRTQHRSTSIYMANANSSIPLWINRLSIWCGHCCGASSVPGLRISTCCRHSPKREQGKGKNIPYSTGNIVNHL